MAAVDHRSTNITNKTQHQAKLTDYAYMLDILRVIYTFSTGPNIHCTFVPFSLPSKDGPMQRIIMYNFGHLLSFLL